VGSTINNKQKKMLNISSHSEFVRHLLKMSKRTFIIKNIGNLRVLSDWLMNNNQK